MKEKQFRFQDLEIWKRGAAVSGPLFRLAVGLEQRRLYRFAEQLRGATLSITKTLPEYFPALDLRGGEHADAVLS